MSRWRALWASGIAMSLTTCGAVGPNFAPPEIQLPIAFQRQHPTQPKDVVVGSEQMRIDAWWTTLNDTELNSLIDQAILANPDVEAALDRVQQAREHELATFGMLLPQIGAVAGVGRGSGTDSVKPPRTASSLDAASNATGFREITGIAGFDATWELDLFGKRRRELEAARYSTEIEREIRNEAIITVVSEVARNYAILRGVQFRLRFLKEDIEQAKKEVNLTETRYRQGLTNEGDVLLARRELETLYAKPPSLDLSIFQAESRIATLLATSAASVVGRLSQYRKLPRTPGGLRSGQPIDLLRRRPDIRRAENELALATARVGVAAADLFPRVLLNAGIGAQGGRVAPGGNPANPGLIWSVGPGLYWPFLDFGRLDAAVRESEFKEQEQFAKYRKVIIAAVEEANTAIARYHSALATSRHLDKAVQVSQRALEFHTGRYEHGIEDFLNVLDAARQLYQLEDRYADAQLDMVLAYVALNKALGGGWELYQEIPPIPVPVPAVAASVRILETGR
jgi:NodT family efflux transporter outer membrane factor (OMF) lipoprotein